MENGLGQVHQKERMVPTLLRRGFSVKAVAMTVFIWKTKYNTQPLIKEKAGEKAGDASNETTLCEHKRKLKKAERESESKFNKFLWVKSSFLHTNCWLVRFHFLKTYLFSDSQWGTESIHSSC